MINKIGISPTFTSNVYVTYYEYTKDAQREEINSEKILEGLGELENNGNPDSVKIRLNPYPPYNAYIRVTEDCDGGKRGLTDMLDKSIPEKYAEIKERLRQGEGEFMQNAPILKYVI